MAEDSNAATRTEQLLEEAVRWLRILAAPTVRGWLLDALKTAEERRVYQASSGASTHDVGKVSGVSHQTVANYWRKWSGFSPRIIEATAVKGRYKRLYDLDELDVPLEPAD